MAQRKPRLRFRLRTLFLFVLVVGVVLTAWQSWLGPYRSQQAVMRALIKANVEYHTYVGGPAWARWIVGEGWFNQVGTVILHQSADEEVLEHVVGLASLKILIADCRALTDDHLAQLGRLPNLKILTLARTSVSAEAVEAKDGPGNALEHG
jgi:hypothetical protein